MKISSQAMDKLARKKEKSPNPKAPGELAEALGRCRAAFGGVALFSAVINILALTGSLYMLQVYDRVLPSRHLPTLVGLTILMVGLYAAFGVLDLFRSRIMSRVGFRLDRLLRGRSLSTVLLLPLRLPAATAGLQPIRDLEQIRSFASGAGPIALFDLPWLPVYLALVFLLHPLLGLLATAGALILLTLTWVTELRSRAPTQASATSAAARLSFAEAARRNAEAIRALGLAARMDERWQRCNEDCLRDQGRAIDVTSGVGAVSRVFRLVLQSALLGLGAYVVILDEATAGVMIAASIMTTRALAPIETAIANWRGFVAARQSYARLGAVLASLPPEEERLNLPRPGGSVTVEGLFVAAPGEQSPIIQDVSFALAAGDGLGVIGPSASGKSTLIRALVGAWLPLRGVIRLDGAALDQWRPDVLGANIGYLPQDVELFAGTVAENIARMETSPPAEAVTTAARAAGVHEMILRLPDGYETRIGEAGARLSAGQRQRIALARALYGDPFLLALDEPNSNLDAEGEAALSAAITAARARGGVVIVIAHRPSALAAVDRLAALVHGRLQAFGPKDKVLAGMRREGTAPIRREGTAPTPRIIQNVQFGGEVR